MHQNKLKKFVLKQNSVRRLKILILIYKWELVLSWVKLQLTDGTSSWACMYNLELNSLAHFEV